MDIEHGLRPAATTKNIAKYRGLVHGLWQVKTNGYSPLHVFVNSAIVLSQLPTRHFPRKQHLVRLFTEASFIANDINVFSWGHHNRTYNEMVDRLANIGMDTGAPVQAHAPSKPGLVQEATTFLDLDVNHSLETSQADINVPQGLVMTKKDLIYSRQAAARRRSAVRYIVLPSK